MDNVFVTWFQVIAGLRHTDVINPISMGTVRITDNNSDGKDIDLQFVGALHVLSPNVYE